LNRVGLDRVWAVLLLVPPWFVVLIYGAAFVLNLHQPKLFPSPESPPPELKIRGRILSADGKVLATSPRQGERLYPMGELAGQVIGYTYRAHGRYGEGLAGVEGDRNVMLGQGNDVVLTLDARVQAIAEEALAHGMERAQARWGAVVVMAPDGRLLAVANAPFFDPQSPRGKPEEDPRLKNYAFRYPFEPGSTIKALTAAVLLETGAVRSGEAIEVPYKRKVGDRWIHDWRWHRPERWTLEEILAHSSNVGISTLAERVPKTTLFRYFERLHLFDPELLQGKLASPQVRPAERWGPVEYANAVFGQGFAVTAVHLAAAMNALVDGRFYTPRLYAGEPELSMRVFKEETAEAVRGMLSRRLSPKARLSGYTLAGKTGTAQIAREGGRGYDPERVVALFGGFVPGDRPRATVVVVLYDPQVPLSERYGSKLAAPVFKEVAAGLIGLWGLPPDRAKLGGR